MLLLLLLLRGEGRAGGEEFDCVGVGFVYPRTPTIHPTTLKISLLLPTTRGKKERERRGDARPGMQVLLLPLDEMFLPFCRVAGHALEGLDGGSVVARDFLLF